MKISHTNFGPDLARARGKIVRSDLYHVTIDYADIPTGFLN